MKKIAIICTTIIMAMIFIVSSSAATDSQYNYETENGKAVITGADKEISGDIIIPEVLDGYRVTAIGERAFYQCDNLISVTIPSSVTTIGMEAFGSCKNLKKIDMLYGIERIESHAFSQCSNLSDVIIPDSVKSIGQLAFCYCPSLEEITIPGSVTEMEDGIFSNCLNLKKAVINDGVTVLGSGMFRSCKTLTEVYLPDTLKEIRSIAFLGCSSLKEIDLPDNLTSMGHDVFSNGIIDLINDQGVYIDGGKYVDGWLVKYVSTDSDIKSIKIADGTVGIADGAFTLAPYIHEITFADSVKYIGAYVTQGVHELKKVIWSNSLISIGDRAFENCYSLGDTLTLPDSLQTIGEKAFRKCEYLWYINFGSGLKSIGNNAFEKCSSLVEITLPKNIEYISDYAFVDCINLQEINWECIADTGKGVFQNTQLTDVVLPSGLEVLPEDTFKSCYSLTTIVIPKTVKTISKNAFKDCGLTTVFYEGTKAQWNKINIDSGNEAFQDAEIKYSYNTEHTHSYSEKRTKKATLKQNGEFLYTCSCGYTYTKELPRVNFIKLSQENYVYNGKAKTPSVEVRNQAGTKLTKGTDYEVTYESGRKAIGKYSAKITLKGNYSGSKTLEFIIRPAKVSKLTVKKNPSTAVLTWSKVEKATGYAVYKYDTAKQKWVRLKKTTSLTYTIKGLNDIDTYNFAVKAYTKTSDGEIYSLNYKKFLIDQYPGIPKIKSIKSTGNGVTVTWSKAKDADGYRIYIYKNGKAIKMTDVKGNTLSTTISDLQKKQTYRIKVQSYKESFTGAILYGGFSNEVSFNLK